MLQNKKMAQTLTGRQVGLLFSYCAVHRIEAAALVPVFMWLFILDCWDAITGTVPLDINKKKYVEQPMSKYGPTKSLLLHQSRLNYPKTNVISLINLYSAVILYSALQRLGLSLNSRLTKECVLSLEGNHSISYTHTANPFSFAFIIHQKSFSNLSTLHFCSNMLISVFKYSIKIRIKVVEKSVV